jgi:isopenicillin N synthase-like dioxygenase
VNDIPVIDLTGSEVAGSAAEAAVVGDIDRACREIGFFSLCGHGIAPAVFEDANRSLAEFFARPLADKQRCRLATGATIAADDYTPYGYSGLLEENAFAYMGVADRPNDYVEKFSVGRLILADGPLPFPDDEDGRVLRGALRVYFRACETLAARVTELFTLALGLPRDFFAVRSDRSDDSMRAHFYPGHSPALANDQGMGEHTDGTLITLLTHTAAGIQVRTRDGTWIAPRFQARDHFITNIGDLMAAWTQSAYVSTPHRVVLGREPRQSIVFFKLTNEDELVRFGNRQMDALFARAPS